MHFAYAFLMVICFDSSNYNLNYFTPGKTSDYTVFCIATLKYKERENEILKYSRKALKLYLKKYSTLVILLIIRCTL